ncbi:hypothetical protein [Sphingobium algorifonticola]|uniref:DUF2157 domain-containing protein n=1 Tax=Sphingobium algorifonticola TaxID=2008318 RepID=A0A437J516_9SPHN|nr:hypothetical protein [Sphingobium algorifonticola]RVT39856.1 hypothetical protein ENE74_14015 [Sphingobium algorifonticola]
MYSESDLQAAIEAGVLDPAAADALRSHVAARRVSPLVDEEHFRLLTGFNDIFVSIASVILLVAVGWLGQNLDGEARFAQRPAILAGVLVAAISWGLAEYFTRRRRMALPSIILLLSFAGGVAMSLIGLVARLVPNAGTQIGALLLSAVALATVGAIWLHWRRFMVPIAVAAGAAAAAGVAISLVLASAPTIDGGIFWVVLLCGIAIFAYAMWWDVSDRSRTTRRSDVAFWLHLAAAPMIAHSLFHLLGVLDGAISIGTAATVIALYVLFGLVALAIDRRALLVSSLAYVLWALSALFREAGAVELSFALTALVIGSALLLLSALWHTARRLVVDGLPENVRIRMPYLDRDAVAV